MRAALHNALEDAELLSTFGLRLVLDHVEADGLRERAALANGDDITLLNLEAWGAVGWCVFVALFESVVLLNIVEVVASDDDGALHLGGNNDTTQDASTDVYITSERALLVDVGTIDGLLGCLVAQTCVLVVAQALGNSGALGLATSNPLNVAALLLLICLLSLFRHLKWGNDVLIIERLHAFGTAMGNAERVVGKVIGM
mgnify:CR=1 FL=1